MSNFCTNCGKPLKKDAKYCINCGKQILGDVAKKSEVKKKDIAKSKKKTEYNLTPSQRNIYFKRILPMIAIGSLIWLISELIFSTIFIEIEFNAVFIIFYVSMIISDVVLFILLYWTSRANKVDLGVLIFFLFSFIAGILTLPISMITIFLPQVHMFISLTVGAVLIVCFMAVMLRENYFAKGYIWQHFILCVIGIVIVEIVFVLAFQIHNFLLTIPISLSYILVAVLIIMFYGVRTVKKHEKESWIRIFFKTEVILLFALFIAVIVAVIVLIIIIVCILGEDLDFGGWPGSGSGKGRKRKKGYQSL